MPSHYARPVHERFRPVHLRHRADGWTAQRQRGFVAAVGRGLSTGDAARAVGMTERSANRLRARDGAFSFAKAWDTARALARPVPERRRPWRIKLHRWRGTVVFREVVWDDVAIGRVLAAHGPSASERAGGLSYAHGAGACEQGVHFRTFQQAHRARAREQGIAAAARAHADALTVSEGRHAGRRRARAGWSATPLQNLVHAVSDDLPHRSRQGRPSRSRPPHGWFGVPAARSTGPP